MRIARARSTCTPLLALVLATTGCGRSALEIDPPSAPGDAAIDAGPGDAGPDPASPDDAGPGDAGPDDGGPPDAGCSIADCDDRVACTVDRCDTGTCRHDPASELCPAQHTCDPIEGCVVQAIANDEETFYVVTLPSGRLDPIGPAPRELFDLAVADDGSVFGADDRGVVRVSLAPPSVTELAPVRHRVLALDADRIGLVGAGGGRVARFDPRTGEETIITTLPPDVVEVGDVAVLRDPVLGDRVLASGTTRERRELLLEIDLATGSTRVVGDIGIECVYGLIPAGPALYGISCRGWVLSIDPTNGRGTGLRRWPVKFLGAARRSDPMRAHPDELVP